jgi:serine/threonine-protein kinase
MSHGRHVLDDYRLEKVIRSTPRTTVIRALDPMTSRRVVIKLVYPPAAVVPEANRSAFLHAAEVARTGALRGIPRVIDFGLTPDEQAFLVMDMVEIAVPVAELGRAPARRLAGIACGVIDAVDTLAMSGVAHLNIRPDNILVTANDTPFVTGFGTAAYLAGAATGVWPAADDPWAAPELDRPGVRADGDLSRADLYSMARVTCALLGADLHWSDSGEPVVRLPEASVREPRELEAVLADALRRDPGARSATMSELRRLLAAEAPTEPFDLDPEGLETREITTPLPLELPPPPPPPEPIPETPSGVQRPEPAGDPRGWSSPANAEPSAAAAHRAPLAPVPAATGAGTPERDGPRWDVIAPIAAGVLLIVVISALLMARSEPTPGPFEATAVSPTAVPTAPARTVAQPTVTAVHPSLQLADRLLMEGDMEGARAVLGELGDSDVDAFNGIEVALWEELTASFGEADRAKAESDLDGGLEYGSVPMLRRAVAGLAGVPRAELDDSPELRRKLDHARRALDAHNRLRDAERQGDPLVVVERSRDMIELLPDYSRAYTLRDSAAAEVEARAEAAIAARDLDSALATYRELERCWPDRAGLAGRIARCEQQLRSEAEMEAVLSRAAEAAERGDLEGAVAVLAATTPSDAYQERFSILRRQLAGQLASIDANPPRITLPADFDYAIRKNETAVVPLDVRDDYRVERVTAWVSGGGTAGYREIALESSGGGLYPLQIEPQLHGNSRALFFVVATDRSGHESRLGSAEQPLSLERRKWFQRLTGGGG